MIQAGKLKEDNPLDLSEPFWKLCEACRRGNLKVCQEMISEGANINAKDQFDYTPLILVSDYQGPTRLASLLMREQRPACVGITKLSSFSSRLALCVNVTPSRASDVFIMR